MTMDNEYRVQPRSTTDGPFYTTDAFTYHAIRFVEERQSSTEQPFFLYLAYTAPHWPHQAHEQDIAKYKGKYLLGWDEIRKQRFKKQKSIGLIDTACRAAPPSDVPAWETLDAIKRDEIDMRMSVYAAMVDCIDQNIGRLLQMLECTGKTENTLLLFLYDGACAEGPPLGRGVIMDPKKQNRQAANNYGAARAHMSSAPFWLYKHYTHEGGAVTPFFMVWPERIERQSEWYASPAQVIDVVPTILDVADAKYPNRMHGDEIPEPRGVSLSAAFDGKPIQRNAPMFSEHEYNAFVIDGEWMLFGRGLSTFDGPIEDQWELYDLSKDRTEFNDPSTIEADRADTMAGQWLQWARNDGVYPKPKSFK